MTNIIISNPEQLKQTIQKMRTDGTTKLHVLADFDYTLTKVYKNNEKNRSLFGSIGYSGYLGTQYTQDDQERFKKYQPIEEDYDLSHAERSHFMREWWELAHNNLIKYGLTQNLLNKICDEHPLNFRDGAKEFFYELHTKNIPLVIMSAAPANMIEYYIQKLDKIYNNIHIVANWYVFDKDDKMIGVKEPVIHSLNKYEITLHHLPIYEDIKKRPNVILLGDNLDDIGMITGFEYKNLIKIGFYNLPTNEHLPKYQEKFDIIITDDGDMTEVNRLLNSILL